MHCTDMTVRRVSRKRSLVQIDHIWFLFKLKTFESCSNWKYLNWKEMQTFSCSSQQFKSAQFWKVQSFPFLMSWRWCLPPSGWQVSSVVLQNSFVLDEAQKPNRIIIYEIIWLFAHFLKLIIFRSSCINVVKFEKKKHAKESSHPPFKMLKATGLPAVMVCSEGEKKLNFDAQIFFWCSTNSKKGWKKTPLQSVEMKGMPPKKESRNMTDLKTPLFNSYGHPLLGLLHLISHMSIKDCFIFLVVWPLGSILFMLHTDIKRRGSLRIFEDFK